MTKVYIISHLKEHGSRETIFVSLDYQNSIQKYKKILKEINPGYQVPELIHESHVAGEQPRSMYFWEFQTLHLDKYYKENIM